MQISKFYCSNEEENGIINQKEIPQCICLHLSRKMDCFCAKEKRDAGPVFLAGRTKKGDFHG
jgi:hypothetical protein